MDSVMWWLVAFIAGPLIGLGIKSALAGLPRAARSVYDLTLHLAAFVGFLFLGATRVPAGAKDWPFAVIAMTVSAVLIAGVVRAAAPLLPRPRRWPS